jgi:hypothetical protein
VTGQALSSYISLHGAASRKDLVLYSAAGGGITIHDIVYLQSSVQVTGNLTVQSGNGAYFNDANNANKGRVWGSTDNCLHVSPAAWGVLDGGWSCTSSFYASALRSNAGCASGTSDDGVWINDLNDSGRRWKLYMYNPGAGYKLYMRYDSSGSGYRAI